MPILHVFYKHISSCTLIILLFKVSVLTGYPIDGAMGSSDGERVRKLSVVCLHNAILLRKTSWLLYCIVGHLNTASAPSILLVLLEPQ